MTIVNKNGSVLKSRRKQNEYSANISLANELNSSFGWKEKRAHTVSQKCPILEDASEYALDTYVKYLS